MVRDDGKRNFAVREAGAETSVFVGDYPRQAAVKAARRLDAVAASEAEAESHPSELRLRERGTDRVHVYEAWAWKEDAPTNGPDWLGDTVTEANVSKQRVEHLE